MLINLSIRRKNGSKIEMADGTVLHFKPDADGDHVANVTDEAHIECLLRIPEYKIKRTKPVSEPVQKAPAQTATPPAQRPVTEGAGNTEKPISTSATEDERKALEAEYQSLYGQAPHPAAKDDTLRAKIAAKKSAQ